jgi:uncharacterized protein YukE
MTAYAVDLDELRDTLASLASCQRDLVSLAADIDLAQEQLQSGWSGRAADAEATSHHDWRSGCADMVAALAVLRGVAAGAEAHDTRAARTNLELWRQVAP